MSESTKTLRVNLGPLRGVGFRVSLANGDRSVVVAGNPSERVFVGSSAACSLRIDDPTVSRRHIALQALGDRLRIIDLSSKNGTVVDGVRVESALAIGGERIVVGQATLDVERVEDVPTSLPALRSAFGAVLGASQAMRRIYPLCERIAASEVPVLIEGETGTGKEMLAEAIHEQGPRANKPFVVFDCTAIATSLLESHLFGHERGAFTGAVASHAGVFEQAHGGTLFIDEIGELDSSLQPKLLRALERREVRRLGASKATHVDVRLLFATRRDLDREVQLGRFRDDLYHRIVVARVELPPLRDREGDVGLLARQFAVAMGHPEAAIPYAVLTRWEDSAWPGNVRELRNAVMRLLEIGEDFPLSDVESASELRRIAEEMVSAKVPLPVARDRVIHQLERHYVTKLLADHGGDVSRAAAASGLARRQFFRIKAKTDRR